MFNRLERVYIPNFSVRQPLSRHLGPGLLLSLALLNVCPAAEELSTDTVEVIGHYEMGVGTSDAASEGAVTAKRVETRPVSRPAEVLEFVPGVIISQHSGEGKANQYYLRGFNLDHGTDLGLTLAGMPINMPTHAHGQGYADLNFLIPELITRVDYRKGPYFAEDGDFSAAGSARISYADTLPQGFASLTLGQWGYRRGLLANSPELGAGHLLYALELNGYDGPWDNPSKVKKVNGILRYSDGTSASGQSITAMLYRNDWNSTDQIPLRDVTAGNISRFGAEDPTDGGRARRYSLSYQGHHDEGAAHYSLDAYLIRSELNLYSNFTYFLDNPINGDQFEQAERRTVFGIHPKAEFFGHLGDMDSITKVGSQVRRDRLDPVALYSTVAQQMISTTREDQVTESSVGIYVENTLQWTEKIRTIAGLRADYYNFDVSSSLAANSGTARDHITSPKLGFVFGPWEKTEYFVNLGRGFHSNDARGTTITVDPKDPSSSAEKVNPLVRARGEEIGVKTEVVPHLQTSLALWRLRLDSELLFVGDAGMTEPSRPSERHGIEWSAHWIPRDWLLFDLDVSASKAKFTVDDPVGNYIPGSVEHVISAGVTVRDLGPWTAAMQVRYFGPRPLIEDNSVRSESTLLVNFRGDYRVNKSWDLGLDIFNLFDRKVSDIDYYYESQLRSESAPVNDIHFHPAEPRNARLTLTVHF